LNDHFGIQTRGGCDCAGTYGHYLLNIDKGKSHKITSKIDKGILLIKPGWVRISIHPVMTNDEANIFCDAITYISKNYRKMSKDYYYDKRINDFFHKNFRGKESEEIKSWLQ